MDIATLQTRLVALISASPLLDGRPVLVEDKGNLVNQVELALQTNSLAVVVALASGELAATASSRAAWSDTFDVVIHRGLLDQDDVPSTAALLEDLRARIHAAPIDPAAPRGHAFAALRHDLRDGGDGTYARVLLISARSTSP